MSRLQWMALRIAAMPMATGLASLVLWLVTEWGPLLVIGYAALGLGVMASLFVPFLLLKAWPASPNLRNTLWIGGLAVANVPVTFCCADVGLARATRYTVTVRNQGTTPWTELQLVHGGSVQDLGTLAAREQISRDVRFQRDGELVLHFVQDDAPAHVVVDGYVTRGLGGSAVVVRRADGSIRVDDK